MLLRIVITIIASSVASYITAAVLRKILPPPSPNQDSKHWVFTSKTRHARIKPVGHSFTYPVLYLALDLDQLAASDARCGLPLAWVNHNRFGLFSIHDGDFLIEATSNHVGRVIRTCEGRICWNASTPRHSIKEKLLACLANMVRYPARPSLEAHKLTVAPE